MVTAAAHMSSSIAQHTHTHTHSQYHRLRLRCRCAGPVCRSTSFSRYQIRYFVLSRAFFPLLFWSALNQQSENHCFEVGSVMQSKPKKWHWMFFSLCLFTAYYYLWSEPERCKWRMEAKWMMEPPKIGFTFSRGLEHNFGHPTLTRWQSTTRICDI